MNRKVVLGSHDYISILNEAFQWNKISQEDMAVLEYTSESMKQMISDALAQSPSELIIADSPDKYSTVLAFINKNIVNAT